MGDASPASARITRASLRLAGTQHAITGLQHPLHEAWLSELTGVAAPRMASQVLSFLCSSDGDPYQKGDAITAARITAAIANVRATGSGAAAIPDGAVPARAWLVPMLNHLGEQSASECSALEQAMTANEPLLTPVASRQVQDQPRPEHPRSEPRLTSAEQMVEYISTLSKQLKYLNYPPSFRLEDKAILHFLEVVNGNMSIPKWSVIEKIGRAGDLLVGQEEWCSFFVVRRAGMHT